MPSVPDPARGDLRQRGQRNNARGARPPNGAAVGTIAHIELARSAPNWMTLPRIAAGLDLSIARLAAAVEAAEGRQPMSSKKSAANQNSPRQSAPPAKRTARLRRRLHDAPASTAPTSVRSSAASSISRSTRSSRSQPDSTRSRALCAHGRGFRTGARPLCKKDRKKAMLRSVCGPKP